MLQTLRVFKALSDRTRFRIVRLLLERDLCVCELTFVLEMAQSRVSHQLRILRDAGLVEDTRDGQWIIYRISPELRSTLASLSRLFREDAPAKRAESADRTRLAVCLRQGIRKSRCLQPSPGEGRRAQSHGRKKSRNNQPKIQGAVHGH